VLPAFSSVAAEVTRYLIGLCAPVQPADALVFEDRPAMDDILQSFERWLQMLDPRLERLQPVLPIDLWRPSALSRPAVTAPPHSTQPLCDRRDRGRLCRPRAWRSLGFDLSLHCPAAPDPLLGVSREGANRRLAARVSIIRLELRAWARSRFGGFRALS
jgi:hypothetical protein